MTLRIKLNIYCNYQKNPSPQGLNQGPNLNQFRDNRIYKSRITSKLICVTRIQSEIWSLRHHQMETFSVLLALCAGHSLVTGEFPAQRPVTRNFDVFFDLRLNKRLSQRWWGWWFEMPLCHYDITVMLVLGDTDKQGASQSIQFNWRKNCKAVVVIHNKWNWTLQC